MKLGRDSESGVYRTFHNTSMSPKRWSSSDEESKEWKRMFDRQTNSIGRSVENVTLMKRDC